MSAERLTRVNGRALFVGRELPDGPWHDEPDHVEFRSPEGLPCILHRNGLGAWCGYVGVPTGHPWHRRGCDDVPAEVHGGLTYAAECQGSICHVPQPGESDDVWWLGFDCVHLGDQSLSDVFCSLERPDIFGHRSDTYRTVEYARAETLLLAAQAAAAASA